jgi:hypothetical protein
MRGVKKHDKTNILKINLTLVIFRTLTHPPTTGVTDFLFAGPLGKVGVPCIGMVHLAARSRSRQNQGQEPRGGGRFKKKVMEVSK